ncbi:MAG TPA: DUF488 domain-containing protein [Blastocatellia bacterium]|nr:DUF488 domain-containing protein [Blastocatellia bacterium]
MIKLKRVYEPPSADDGIRILVERLWPRGISKEKARVDEWLKEIAPSQELRKWFQHDPAKWEEFQERYRKELDQNQELVNNLKRKAKGKTVTFIYAASDEERNSAMLLKNYLKNR